MDYFTADFHFGHSNIIRLSNRPFGNVYDMDKTLLDNLNSVVKEDDNLYILGDFAWRKKDIPLYRKRIVCRNVYLVLGNHDKVSDEHTTLFSWVKPIAEISIGKQHITLSHYAMRVWNKSHCGAWCLHGHSHGRLVDVSPHILLSMDVGVDTHNFYPWSYTEVQEYMDARKSLLATLRREVEG